MAYAIPLSLQGRSKKSRVILERVQQMNSQTREARPRKVVCSTCGDYATRIIGTHRFCSHCEPI